MQALQLALRGAGDAVFLLNRSLDQKLRWLDEHSLGFTNSDGETF
jgi:hypothetical protein